MLKIVEFFEGKNIFVTGGSGFLGKVLIEKLLRICPKIGTIYILLREKKGKSVESRIDYITNLALFDKLRQENPDVLKKLVPIKGDICEKDLGISDSDRQMLINNVHIIYHTAASVRFDDLLGSAILVNVRGTRDIAKLALELKKISIFVHISTTYCNTDKKVVEERLYPAHADWRDAIKIAEECDETLLNSMATKYISPLPNTYTFAKSLAEHVVNDMCKGKIPAIILRPSVVISTLSEPIPGWIDNFNGPVGLLVAGGKGLLRTVLGRRDILVDYMPVDVLIKGIIVASVYDAGKRSNNEVEVYNASQQKVNAIQMGEVIDMGVKLIQDFPFPTILWYPRFAMTSCWYMYYVQVILFHMLPAFFLDIGLRLFGQKPRLFTIQRKIYIANTVLAHFMENSWLFINEKLIKLLDLINDDEKEMFFVPIKMSREDLYEFFKLSKIGSAKFLLKEEMDKEKNRKNLNKLWYVDMTVRTVFFIFLFWLLTVKINIVKMIFTAVENYIMTLR